MLLDHAGTYPNTVIHYKASNMVLNVYSDVAYITIPEARTCNAIHFYLRDCPLPRPINPTPKRNSPIHTYCNTTRYVVPSEAEAKTCGSFNNGKAAIGMRSSLIALEHKKPVKPPKSDSSIKEYFVNSDMKLK